MKLYQLKHNDVNKKINCYSIKIIKIEVWIKEKNKICKLLNWMHFRNTKSQYSSFKIKIFENEKVWVTFFQIMLWMKETKKKQMA